MSDKEATKKQIDDKLNDIMELLDEQVDEDLPQIIRLFAKLLFNVRYDLNEMKLELLKVFKDECEEVNHKEEEEDGRFYT